MTPGQAFQLMAVIAQKLGKIGLDFDSAEMLIGKPDLTLKRLRALKSEKIVNPANVATNRFTVIESLEIENLPNCTSMDQVLDYLLLDKQIEKYLKSPEYDSMKYNDHHSYCARDKSLFKSTTVNQPMYPLPIFREALDYCGPDNGIWELLYRRKALFTIDEVLGFLCGLINTGEDPLGLLESGYSTVWFPVVLHRPGEFWDIKTEAVTLVRISKGELLKKQLTWHVGFYGVHNVISIREGVSQIVYFANDPRIRSRQE